MFLPRFLGVHVDELVDAFDERVGETRLDRAGPPSLEDARGIARKRAPTFGDGGF